MTDPDISADYTLCPSEPASTLALPVEARQPASSGDRPAPPSRRSPGRSRPTRAASTWISGRCCPIPPVCAASPGTIRRTAPAGRRRPSCRPRTIRAPFRQPGEVAVGAAVGAGGTLPAGARPRGRRVRAARGRLAHRLRHRETDGVVVHRMPTPLVSRFIHLEIRVDTADWCAWSAANGIAPVLDIARDTLGAAWASSRSKYKKADLARAMEEAFAADTPPVGLGAMAYAAALAWTPPGFAAFDAGVQQSPTPPATAMA